MENLANHSRGTRCLGDSKKKLLHVQSCLIWPAAVFELASPCERARIVAVHSVLGRANVVCGPRLVVCQCRAY